jgi:hypothetical protein
MRLLAPQFRSINRRRVELQHFFGVVPKVDRSSALKQEVAMFLKPAQFFQNRLSAALALTMLYSLLFLDQASGESGKALEQIGSKKGNLQLVIASRDGDESYELWLEMPVQPSHIAGQYRRGSKGITFKSDSTEAGMSFTISTLAGIEIYSVTQDEEYIRSKLLGSRVRTTFDLSFLDDAREQKSTNDEFFGIGGASVEGELAAVEEYLSMPERAFLPHLSRLIGQRLGYTGTAYPSTLPLHLMALSVRTDSSVVRLPKDTYSTLKPIAGAACEAYPFPENGCYGMCGPGCKCWSWVCGDCCFHTGCAVHDDYCRTWLGFAHPYCIDFWIPFLIGGGC